MSWEKIDEIFREQAKGIRCYMESEFAPLKACLAGDAETVYGPNPDTPEYVNMLGESMDEETLNYLRKIQNKNLKDVDPEMYEQWKYESDTLAKTLRKEGVRLIRNETGFVPNEILNFQTGWGGPMFLSLFGQSAFEVVGNCFISTWEVGVMRHIELLYRAATNEIMKNDPNAVWLTMPFPSPNSSKAINHPMLSPGDFRIMPNKIVIIGIGVSDASHISDLSKPRSSGDEYGVEILRRMLKPFGWRVETVYFDSRLTYHIDCLMMAIDEGVIGLPDDGKHGLWTALPKEFENWEIVDVPVEELHMGVCNNEVIGNKRVLMTEGAKQTKREIEKLGYTPVEVPYSSIYEHTGSGIHCSLGKYWREY